MDELWDEGAIAGDDAAVGAALLMADLEGAIAAAGDEIASLRRVTETVPRPGLPPSRAEGAVAAPEPVAPELAPTAPETARAVLAMPDEGPGQTVVEPLSRGSTEPAVASLLPESVAPVGTPAVALDRAAPMRAAATVWPFPGVEADSRASALPASVAASEKATDLVASAPVASSVDRLLASNDAAPSTALTAGAAAEPAAPVSPVASPPMEQQGGFAEHAMPEPPASPLATVLGSQAAPVRLSGASAADASVAAPSSGIASAGEPDEKATSQDAGRTGPTEGDVYLDGERVGRWMARHLARELGAPQAAGTGFDPRLGPAWPGSMHGN